MIGNQKVFIVHVSRPQEESSSKIIVWKEEGKTVILRRKVVQERWIINTTKDCR